MILNVRTMCQGSQRGESSLFREVLSAIVEEIREPMAGDKPESRFRAGGDDAGKDVPAGC